MICHSTSCKMKNVQVRYVPPLVRETNTRQAFCTIFELEYLITLLVSIVSFSAEKLYSKAGVFHSSRVIPVVLFTKNHFFFIFHFFQNREIENIIFTTQVTYFSS